MTKTFDAYANVIKSYRVRTLIHPSLVKANLLKIGVQDTNNLTPEEK